MKVSVIISACPNREALFERSLYTYSKQNFDKKEFEILLVDDGDRSELLELCELAYVNYGLQFRYVKIDPSKSAYPSRAFTPALTNNVGFRLADGEVVVITGPETMQAENNIAVAYTMAFRRECAYGLVYRAAPEFNRHLEEVDWKKQPFSEILKYPGAQAECRTRPPHPPAYWYCMAVSRGYAMQIQGVDERFLEGICAEDDDFANRMKFAGITPVFEHRIVGIHQNHDYGDSEDPTHNIRKTSKWNEMRKHNVALMYENIKSGDPIANKNHVWGNPDIIVNEVIYR
jgi:glycosyltransferase involved in cell wall biosynthesis